MPLVLAAVTAGSDELATSSVATTVEFHVIRHILDKDRLDRFLKQQAANAAGDSIRDASFLGALVVCKPSDIPSGRCRGRCEESSNKRYLHGVKIKRYSLA